MKYIAVLIASFFAINVMAQTSIDASELPNYVSKNFKKKYPRAQEIEWFQDEDIYFANFWLEEEYTTAKYKENGDLKIAITEKYYKDLVPQITDYIKDNYGFLKIDSAFYIEKGEKEKFYKIRLFEKIKDTEPEDYPVTFLFFTSAGQFYKVTGAEAKIASADDKNTNSTKVILEKDVPELVLKDFNRKYSRAQEVVWLKDGDKYISNYYLYDEKCKNIYKKDGTLEKVIKEVFYNDLRPNIHDYMNEHYKYLKIDSCFLVEEGRKNRYYRIVGYEKVRGVDPEDYPVTEIQFTSIGQFLTAILPDPIDNDNDEYIDEDFKEEVEEEMQEGTFENSGDQNITKKELPSTALEYLALNFDYDWRYDVVQIRETEEWGQVYYVKMKLEGNKDYVEHYFDIKGKLLKDKKGKE